jgi:hypothetical protein
MDVLRLIGLKRPGVQHPDGSYKLERRFLDFVINGQSLWEVVGKPRDLVSVFCFEYGQDRINDAAARLLLRENADLPNDRRSLFICSECTDLACGAVTALILKQDSVISWENFGYENTYESVTFKDYEAIGPFRFDVVSYERVLRQAIEDLRGPGT